MATYEYHTIAKIEAKWKKLFGECLFIDNDLADVRTYEATKNKINRILDDLGMIINDAEALMDTVDFTASSKDIAEGHLKLRDMIAKSQAFIEKIKKRKAELKVA